VIDVRISGQSVHLSRDEGWKLQTWLADRAPFVRNQLMVVRHGGSGAVTLQTPEERRDVLDALAGAGRDEETLTGGLLALEVALAGAGTPASSTRSRA
jgi:hypothetical protein